MGDRAVITTADKKLGVYLHWNGGLDCVSAFLRYCELCQFRASSTYPCGLTTLANVICNFFGNGLSCYIGEYSKLDCDNKDNGVYIIEGWKIIAREFKPEHESEACKMETMLDEINIRQGHQYQQLFEKAYKGKLLKR